MHPTIAKGIAANIRSIAECTVQIALIDALPERNADHHQARVELCRKVEKAQRNIAEWLEGL